MTSLETTIEILPVTIDDLDDLVALNEEFMFYGYGVRLHFEEVLKNPDNLAFKCIVNGNFAGAIVYVKGIALLGNHNELNEQIKRLAENKNIYTGDTIVVKKAYRRLGLAGKLCLTMVDELKKHGARLALNEFWVYPNGNVPAFKAFKAFEKYRYLGRFENFYKGLNELGFICSVCGDSCICSADIYLAEVPE